MYWVNRKILSKVLRNPYDSSELIKLNKVNDLFMQIYDQYENDYPQNWAKSTIPLNYFLDKYVDMTGSDRKSLEKGFIDYLNKNEVKDFTEKEDEGESK